MNDKGQIIITEILFYILLSVIILSVIIYATETINDYQVTGINNRQLNKLLEDNLLTLTKTSGKPENWEKINTNKIETIGLKQTKTDMLDYDKIMRLKDSPQLLENHFPDGVSYVLMLYPKNNPNKREVIAQRGTFNNRKQIRAKNRTVIIDYKLKSTFLKNNESCPYEHDDKWSCITINVNENILSNTKYYLLSDSNIEYILSNTYSDNITGQTQKTCINSQIMQLIKNDNQTIHVHTKSDTNNTYLVRDANNRERFIESVIKPEIYVLKLIIAV